MLHGMPRYRHSFPHSSHHWRNPCSAVHLMVLKSKSKSKAGAVVTESDNSDKSIPEGNWPKAVQLRTGALTQQTDLIWVACHEAIRIVKKTLVMEHAWPELHKGTLYKWQVLLEAVKLLCAKNTEDDEGKQDAQYKALNSHLLNDETFVRYIGKWVCDLVTSLLNALTIDIGRWSSITSPWTNLKCGLRPDRNFSARHWRQMFAMCPCIDWEWCVHISWALGCG